MSRWRDERGFTLIELMVTVAVGTVVMLAAYAVLDSGTRLTGEVTDRQEALQRGRLAMELITRELRSQMCLTSARPGIVAGSTGNSVTIVVNMRDPLTAALPEQRVLTYDPAAQTITERRYTSTGSMPNVTFSSTPYKTTVLLDHVVPATVGAPIFTYQGWTGSPPTPTLALNSPLSAADALKVAWVGVTFTVQPQHLRSPSSSSTWTTFDDGVFLRGSDSSKPNATAPC